MLGLGRQAGTPYDRTWLTVKLLFDQNLAPVLAQRLADLHPDSQHVQDVGLGSTDDTVIWEHARDQGLAIVTKDGDYADLCELRGFPPKIIWIRRGNCSTAEIESLLRQYAWAIDAFATEPTRGCLIIQ